MRLLAILLALIIVFVVIGIETENEIQKTTEKMLTLVPWTEQHIMHKEWDAALVRAEELLSIWEDMNIRWELFVSHHEIDQLETTINTLISQIKTEETGGAIEHLTTLRVRLVQIQRQESFSLKNIF